MAAPSIVLSLSRKSRRLLPGLGLISLGALLAWPQPAAALGPASQRELQLDDRAGLPALRDGRPSTGRTPASAIQARAALEAELGQDLIVSFDADTGVPQWLIPAGHTQVPGANGPGSAAESFALAFLARHIDALAPGSSPADLVLVSDVRQQGLRTLGFSQRHQGRELIGGQLSFSFRSDTLVAVRSTALPHVQLPQPSSAIASGASLADGARAWISRDFTQGELSRTRVDGPLSAPAILPLILASGHIEYREVVAVDVRGDAPGQHWQVWVDAHTAEPLARRSLTHDAQLRYLSYRRGLLGDRVQFPASRVFVDAGAQLQTDAGGNLQLMGPTPLSFSPAGPFASMTSAQGPLLVSEANVGVDQTLVIDVGDDDLLDAQVMAYVHTMIVKDRIRSIDPGFSVVDLQTPITVNIDDICNAFADGETINFFAAGGGCENTALISDIIYHEYGHVAHVIGMQPGVGIFDGAVSEGASDYLSATIVDDPRVGVGFFTGSDEPIRDLDPPGQEWTWPDDQGEVHDEGRILGGTLWDLRELLIEKYDPQLGAAKVDAIWLGGIRRSVDMPSWYVEALIANDDDGNLQNGTPDVCEIDQVFDQHGLSGQIGALVGAEEQPNPDGSTTISVVYEEGMSLCGGPSNSPSALLSWADDEGGSPDFGTVASVEMVEVVPGRLEATIPPQAQLSLTHYQVNFNWGNGNEDILTLPDNEADDWYQLWTGEVTEIWCEDFESQPQSQWNAQGEWAFGMPQGGAGDPSGAYEGARAAGVVLGQVGAYSPWATSFMDGPAIDVSGFEGVRLHYRRWLNVEDGFWDQAQILANGQLAWQNRASPSQPQANVHHRDREWRLHSLDLRPFVSPEGTVQLSFTNISDGGLEFGGWNIDALCIVGHGVAPEEPDPDPDPDPEDPAGLCGDGFVDTFEQCDDGNLQNGDGCSSGCLVEDEGPEPEPEEPELGWDPGGRGCGCGVDDEVSGAGGGAPPVGLALGLLGLLGLRRRARRDRAPE